MDFQAYLASSGEECSNDEIWPTEGKENKSLTEEEKIANYRVRILVKIVQCTSHTYIYNIGFSVILFQPLTIILLDYFNIAITFQLR